MKPATAEKAQQAIPEGTDKSQLDAMMPSAADRYDYPTHCKHKPDVVLFTLHQGLDT